MPVAMHVGIRQTFASIHFYARSIIRGIDRGRFFYGAIIESNE
jgi:hypothetical protein